MEDTGIIFEPKKSTLRAWTLGSLLILLVSIAIMLTLDQLQYGVLRLPALVVGFIGSVLGGYLFLFNVARLMRPQPVLATDDEGISFHLSPLSHGSIPWSEVKSYSLVKRGPRKFILIFLHHPQQFLNSTKGLRKRRFRTAMRLFQTPWAIPTNLLKADPEAVIHAIRSARP